MFRRTALKSLLSFLPASLALGSKPSASDGDAKALIRHLTRKYDPAGCKLGRGAQINPELFPELFRELKAQNFKIFYVSYSKGKGSPFFTEYTIRGAWSMTWWLAFVRDDQVFAIDFPHSEITPTVETLMATFHGEKIDIPNTPKAYSSFDDLRVWSSRIL